MIFLGQTCHSRSKGCGWGKGGIVTGSGRLTVFYLDSMSTSGFAGTIACEMTLLSTMEALASAAIFLLLLFGCSFADY